jgi:flagellum-specific ATP synthase
MEQYRYQDRLRSADLFRTSGRIIKSIGILYEAHLPGAAVGSLCQIFADGRFDRDHLVEAEVVGFRDDRVMLMPFEQAHKISTDSQVLLRRETSSISVSPAMLGRVLDGYGNPIDGKGPILHSAGTMDRNLYDRPTHPLEREMIRQPLDLGIKSINGILTTGKGQRVGIMAGSGVGKSVLLGMMARNTTADVNVIALIGERGREVREFIERDLGPEGMARSIVVVATSDQSPLLRMRGAFLATSIAEYFRDQGGDVLLLVDSITRFCMAQREIGLSMGEPPASKGYTPSVFSTLPKLLERAGTAPGRGSITGLYTVLVEGDDMDDPVADSARSILDGHIVLSRKLAERGHFPAVDVLQSTSRVMASVTEPDHRKAATLVRELIAVYREAEDLINIGAYVRGANPRIDMAVAQNERIQKFLRQAVEEKVSYERTIAELKAIQRAAETASVKPAS